MNCDGMVIDDFLITNPPNLAYTAYYNGKEELPKDAGNYQLLAYVEDDG